MCGHYGCPIVLVSVRENFEVSNEAWKKRALAIDKDQFVRNRRGWASRVRDQVVGFGFEPGYGHILEGKVMDKKEEQYATKIFAVKTTTGQEKNVARLVAAKVAMTKVPIKAILVPDTLKGYVFMEADGPHLVEEAIAGVRHVRSRVPGLVSFSEVERYIVRKPVIEDLSEDDVVEITGGPFKGMRAKITRIDKSKGEVTLELLEATFTLPITVHSDYVKLVERARTRSGGA